VRGLEARLGWFVSFTRGVEGEAYRNQTLRSF
jgi:hypothetical protein